MTSNLDDDIASVFAASEVNEPTSLSLATATATIGVSINTNVSGAMRQKDAHINQLS